VSCYTSVAMGEALPALANIRNVFEHRGPHATNLTVGSYRWCWHSCDGAYLTFYAREQSRLSHYDYFWLLEWDVVWTGSLPAILAAWSVTEPPASGSTALAESLRGSSAKFWTPLVEGLPLPRGKDAQRVLDKYRDDPVVVDALREHGGRAPTRVGPSELRAAEDLICPNPAEVSRRWQHSPKRNYSLVHQNATRMCVTEVTRMSARLLREVVAFGQRRDAGMFCEMRAPVVCQRLPWCSVRSLFDSAHEQYLFANRTLWVRSWGIPTFGLSSLMDTGTGRTKTDRDVLYHAYKWPQKGFDPPRGEGQPALYDDLVGPAALPAALSAALPTTHTQHAKRLPSPGHATLWPRGHGKRANSSSSSSISGSSSSSSSISGSSGSSRSSSRSSSISGTSASPRGGEGRADERLQGRSELMRREAALVAELQAVRQQLQERGLEGRTRMHAMHARAIPQLKR
jgi:uncharacterized membrane protein YgcG